MAGSRAWYVYTDDDENSYAVELDENVGALVPAGFTVYTSAEALDLMPKGMKMRYVNAVQISGAGAGYRSRRIPCGTTEATLYGGTTQSVVLNDLTYAVTSKRGERKRLPTIQPTGLVGQSSAVGGSAGGIQ